MKKLILMVSLCCLALPVAQAVVQGSEVSYR